MRTGNLARDVQAQSSTGLLVPDIGRPVELVENPLAVAIRNAGSLVDNADADAFGIGFGGEGDGGAGPRILKALSITCRRARPISSASI